MVSLLQKTKKRNLETLTAQYSSNTSNRQQRPGFLRTHWCLGDSCAEHPDPIPNQCNTHHHENNLYGIVREPHHFTTSLQRAGGLHGLISQKGAYLS